MTKKARGERARQIHAQVNENGGMWTDALIEELLELVVDEYKEACDEEKEIYSEIVS